MSCSRSCNPARSRSPTGCSAAWRRRRTWSRKPLLRFHTAVAAGEQIESPRAYVATVVTGSSIDQLRSARARRESYVANGSRSRSCPMSQEDPARHAEMADSLSLAFLVLLESLSPEQRAVLLLRDVFDYGYPEIAGIVGKSEDNVRQLASRARKPRRGAAAPGSRLRESSATSWRGASSRHPRRATWPRSSPCSPKTWCCTGTGAARRPRSPGRFTAAAASGAHCWLWMKQGARIEGAGHRSDRGERPTGRDPFTTAATALSA